MSAAIQQAALSYFGLPEGTQLVEGGPVGCFAFVVPLTEEHLRGIADRMKALAEVVPGVPVAVVDSFTNMSKSQLRGEYDSMTAAEKARFGSFGQYCAHAVMGTAQDDALMHRDNA